MNSFTIHTRSMGKITFSNPGGLVYCDFGDRERDGILGTRICEGGEFAGMPLAATDGDLERKCRLWLRAFYRDTNPKDRSIMLTLKTNPTAAWPMLDGTETDGFSA